MKPNNTKHPQPEIKIQVEGVSLFLFLMATSKNYFLMVWARDFVLTKVLEIPEYFVYCGIFKTHCQGKRSVQTAKG